MIHKIGSQIPDAQSAAFIAWNAEVAGSVVLGKDTSVWFGAAIRGDINSITVGDESNIQDNATLHITSEDPCIIGKRVTVGHNAVVHGAEVKDECLIGIGAVILNKAVIGTQSIVGAGALVTERKEFPPRSLIMGSPARLIRSLTDDEVKSIGESAKRYVRVAKEAAAGYCEIP